ncbi:hypothetical protein [Streptomyces sp. NBC_00582]|uniref:hypothetical protein n=1 Tax=Streptomyces sp. NBC_00582 TaxID=2975783 RepID=UPI0010EBD51C|nr:hypothetical protein [Streptomyces sp. NBC_00582]WUB68281.1 hypothetical protein OG852_23760 [Streptomyces sp. NBC_00582]
MQATKDAAFAKAVEWQSLSPVQIGAEEAARTAPADFLAICRSDSSWRKEP